MPVVTTAWRPSDLLRSKSNLPSFETIPLSLPKLIESPPKSPLSVDAALKSTPAPARWNAPQDWCILVDGEDGSDGILPPPLSFGPDTKPLIDYYQYANNTFTHPSDQRPPLKSSTSSPPSRRTSHKRFRTNSTSSISTTSSNLSTPPSTLGLQARPRSGARGQSVSFSTQYYPPLSTPSSTSSSSPPGSPATPDRIIHDISLKDDDQVEIIWSTVLLPVWRQRQELDWCPFCLLFKWYVTCVTRLKAKECKPKRGRGWKQKQRSNPFYFLVAAASSSFLAALILRTPMSLASVRARRRVV